MESTFLTIKFALMYGLEVGVIGIAVAALLIGLGQIIRLRVGRVADKSISDRSLRPVKVQRARK